MHPSSGELFQLMVSDLDLSRVIEEVDAHPELWDANPQRLLGVGPHRETHDIWVRYKDNARNLQTGDWSDFADEHVPIWYPSATALPSVVSLVSDLMVMVRGEMLGGVLIYSVPAGKQIYVHTDTGWHPDYFAKFNFALQSQEGCSFYYPEHSQEMCAKTGDLHFFRNTVPHGVRNDSSKDQLILTVCIRTPMYQEK